MARVTLNWTLPTQRADTRPLSPSEIDFTEISMSADGGATFATPVEVPADAAQTFSVDGLSDGDYIFRAVVVDKVGLRSDNADAPAQILTSPPAAIADLTVTIE